MENLLVSQKVGLVFIIFPAIIASIIIVVSRLKIGLLLILYGLVVISISLVPSILFKDKSSIINLLILAERGGVFSKGYVVGCAIILTGLIVWFSELVGRYLKSKS